MDHLYGSRFEAEYRRQAELKRKQAAAQRDAQLRTQSLNQHHQPPTKPDPHGGGPIKEMPDEVRQQLDNHHCFGLWLESKYPTRMREHWWAVWLEESPEGQKVAALIAEEVAAKADAAMQREADRRTKEVLRTQRRKEIEEAWSRPVGSVVRISGSRTFADGRVGIVQGMLWVGEELMADVAVDPLPPDHPMRRWTKRDRPMSCMPQVYRVPAKGLRPEHPEMA